MRALPLPALLGVVLGACASEPPTADYDLAGTVVDAATLAPIEGAQVYFSGKSTLSLADGTWALSAEGLDPCGSSCQVMASDPEGAYGPAVLAIFPEQVEEGDGAYEGRFQDLDIAIELVPE